MRRYVAVDGGNSKTDVVIGLDSGEVLASVRGPDTCYQNIGLPETLSRLRALVDQARVAAGLAADDVFDRAEVYLAGADLPEEVSLLASAVLDLGWAAELRLDNDTFALLRAGTDAPDAVAVVCGAGINCVGRNAEGRTARFPSLGQITGDWGGGGHLGILTLFHAIRGEDGRGPLTALTAAVAGHFGLSTVHEVASAVHLGSLADSRLSELTPVLFGVAAGGDEVAASVVARQAEEIVALATVAAARLDLLDAPHVLVLGGGVLRPRHALLHDAVLAGVHARASKATIVAVDAPPVLGAALHALDALHATPAAHHTLRAHFA